MRRPSGRSVVLDAWPLLLSLVLCWPLLTGRGLPLARDLVFVPRQPFTDASIGLGDAAPRAVPLDAVVALLSQAVGGEVLARVWSRACSRSPAAVPTGCCAGTGRRPGSRPAGSRSGTPGRWSDSRSASGR